MGKSVGPLVLTWFRSPGTVHNVMKLGLMCWWILILLSVGSFGASSGDVRLLQAVQNKDTDAVLSLLKQHVDVNAPAPDGATALAWAVHENDLNTINLLISAGANVNTANDYGATPLWLACYNSSAGIVQRLLEAGADPNAAHLPAGETALLRCSRTGNLEAVMSLLAHGADVNAKENTDQTALMWALEERHPDVARVLMEHEADVNAISHGGFTPLLFAARQGDVESGRLLLEKGANLNVTTPDGFRKGEKFRVPVTAQNRVDLNWFQRDKPEEPMSPLQLAVNSGREQFAVFLVEHGANPNVADSHGISVLHSAMQRGISDLGGVLRDPRYYTALEFVFRPNMPDLVRALLEHGANLNVRLKKVPPMMRNLDKPRIDSTGGTPLLLAAATGDLKIMKMLLAKGADPSLTTVDGTTALMAAAGLSRMEGNRTKEEEEEALGVIKLLVELGADVNASNKSGLTAMHGAAYTGANQIIQFLADHGANLDVKDKFGESPLSIASGDPNWLKEDFFRRAQPRTEALLRKLLGDHFSLVDVTRGPDIGAAKSGP
jgi:uncharacterized protein